MSDQPNLAGLFADLPADDFGQVGQVYPTWQWVNGDQRQKKSGDVSYHGGWFLPEEQAPAGIELPPWTLVTQEGKEIEGYAQPALSVAVLTYRQCWTLGRDEGGMGGNQRRYPWNAYEQIKSQRPRSQMHVLVAVQGQEAHGPMVLSVRGMAGKAMKDIISGINKTLKAPATNIVRAQLKAQGQDPKAFPGVPLRSFWTLIGYAKKADGPSFIKVGQGEESSMITPPAAWALPAKPPADWKQVEPYFVGQGPLAIFSDWFLDAEEWRQAWDKPQEAQGGNGGTGIGSPAEDNVVFVRGELTRDIDLRYTPQGTAVATANVAVSHVYRDKQEITYIDAVVWGKQAEEIATWSKGDRVQVTGRLSYRSWEDQSSGTKKGKHQIMARNIECLESSLREGVENVVDDGSVGSFEEEIPF